MDFRRAAREIIWTCAVILPIQTGDMTPSPEKLLSAWHALEVLTVGLLKTEPTKGRFKPPSEDPESEETDAIDIEHNWRHAPWFDARFRKQPEETGLTWWVFLGRLNLSATMERLLMDFGDPHAEERDYPEGKSPIAVLMLDADGRLIADKIFLASFAWGTGQVINGNVGNLSQFAVAEAKIKMKLSTILERKGHDTPVSADALKELWDCLKEELKIPSELIFDHGVALRKRTTAGKPVPPEPEMLNSFFLADLQHALDKAPAIRANASSALTRYLSANPDGGLEDIDASPNLRRDLLEPSRIPAACWPGQRFPGTKLRPSLSLMQQLAVNSIAERLKNGGLFTVNGPPGTGKTTLLRDIYANVLCDRALVLLTVKDPKKAFSDLPQSDMVGQAEISVRRIRELSLIGHEMLVVSSNNSAVENISNELPQKKHIGDDLHEQLEYFSAVSDFMAQNDLDEEDAKEGLLAGTRKPEKTWGLAAAVLGKKENRSKFNKTFYFDSKKSWRALVKGREFYPLLWNEAKENFTAAYSSFESHRTALARGWEAFKQFEVKSASAREAKLLLHGLTERLVETNRDIAAAIRKSESLTAEVNSNTLLLSSHLATRPNWFQIERWRWLFDGSRRKNWECKKKNLSEELERITAALTSIEKKLEKWEAEMAALKIEKAGAEKTIATLEAELSKLDREIASARVLAGNTFPDDDFWSRDTEELEKSNPWLSAELQEKRVAVFTAAVKLHESFACFAHEALLANINQLVAVFKGEKSAKDFSEDDYQSMWTSLFLVVPLVSSTFAAVERMCGTPHGPVFGWLLVDEAGQAPPQFAVGALSRARRAVVVGDPLQIPPVVTTPPLLTSAICNHFGVKAGHWAAPENSVQIQGDRANRLGRISHTTKQSVWVGSPLVVHRRCENPMFEVANAIAYQGKMVKATVGSESVLAGKLGKSAWINVEGADREKFVLEEAQVLSSILESIENLRLSDTDIYVISPFKAVASGVEDVLGSLSAILSIGRRPGNRIGTVHKFQGKEASVVFFVLGAQGKDRVGARMWATDPENIVNVAITRAKHRIFVIGSFRDWSQMGCMETLARSLDVVSPHDFVRRLGTTSPASKGAS